MGELWWVGRTGSYGVVLALGHGRQYFCIVPCIVPELELVVATTATWRGLGAGAGPQMAAIADLITGGIVPAVRPSGS
jgi:hypothetical protein